MADSDNSTSLPFVTVGGQGKSPWSDRIKPVDAHKPRISSVTDPALVLANNWCDAHGRAMALCRRQQRLESRIARTSGIPPSPPSDDASTFPRRKHADLELSYLKAKAAEEQSINVADRLLEELVQTPAQSLDGLIAKLEVVLTESEIRDAPADFPWPHLRSVLVDLRKLATTNHPSMM